MMKRPIEEEYIVDNIFLSSSYIDDVEDYCDYLERENKKLIDKVDKYKHEYYSECDLREVLEKAFSKSCEVLEDLSRFTQKGSVIRTKEEWKEWCLKDVD